MATRKKAAAAGAGAEEKPKRKPRDPNAPPREVRPLRTRPFLQRDRVEAAMTACGWSLDKLYDAMESGGSARMKSLPLAVLTAYAMFQVHHSIQRFMTDSGIPKNRIDVVLGRCARLQALGRIPELAATPEDEPADEPEATESGSDDSDWPAESDVATN